MSHGRHDFPMAIHLLRVRGRAAREIFFPAVILREHPEHSREHAPDLQFWESLVARACDRHDAKVHGYTWLPNEAILLLQRFGVPLRIILASLLGRYSRYLHERGRVPREESPYLSRCDSIEVTPELLPYALRNLYAWPMRAGLCASPLTYPLCSVSLHLSDSVPSWFETQEFIARVRKRGHIERASVEQFLVKPQSHRHVGLFSRLSARTPQIAGERYDMEESEWLAEHPAPVLRVEQVAESVAMLLRKESKPLGGVLAAALTTWYATRTGAQTLAQMGRWFDREPTTLRADIESHRKTSAALFELTVEELQALIPAIAPEPAAMRAVSRSDVAGLAATRSSVSGASVSATPRMLQRRGGPSPPRAASEFASTGMISKEDASSAAQCDSELSVLAPRRTRRRP